MYCVYLQAITIATEYTCRPHTYIYPNLGTTVDFSKKTLTPTIIIICYIIIVYIPPHIHYLIKSPQYKELGAQLYFHPASLLPDEGINYDHISEELRKGNMEGKPRLPRLGPGFLEVAK